MNEADPREIDAPPASLRKIVIGTGVAVLVSAVVLAVFVLPAEFGIDPTGTGESTGLNNLAAAGEMTELERGALREGRVLTLSDAATLPDRWEHELAPFEMVEFKYTMAEGAPLLFKWSASGPLQYDMHAHPFDGGEELTESYAVGEARAMQGSYVAPFSGIHGWFWQNRSMDNVTLVLETMGGFTASTIYEGNAAIDRPIRGVESPATQAAPVHSAPGG